MICICSSHASWHHVCDIPAQMNDRRVEEMQKRTTNLKRKETTMKVIPAVLFQKQLNGVKEDAQKPERLALFESQLREVVGGATFLGSRVGGTTVKVSYGGSTTYSGSAGWLDVEQADDCAG
jgi:hypothetical protein